MYYAEMSPQAEEHHADERKNARTSIGSQHRLPAA
jgi:hypothetical protein